MRGNILGIVATAAALVAFGQAARAETLDIVYTGTIESGSTNDTLNLFGGGSLVGDSFTAADVYAGSQIGFGLMFKTFEPRPAFQQYWQRISARPAYARARDLDEALMATPQPAR